jgi:hypothetical protein
MIRDILKLTVAAVLAFMIGVSLARLVGSKGHSNDAIVKMGSDGRPHCTAFVVSNKYAVTALHCVMDDIATVMAGEFVALPNTQLFDADNRALRDVKVHPPRDPRMDVAVLEGWFWDFKKLPMSRDYNDLAPGNTLVTCGYPFMTNILKCNDLESKGNFMQALGATGYMIFGYSGGPVTYNGKVIAVNSGLAEGTIVVAPALAMEALFNLPDFYTGVE